MSNEKARAFRIGNHYPQSGVLSVKQCDEIAQAYADQENAALKEALAVARKYMMCPIEMDGLEYMKETEIVRQHLTNNPCNHPKGSVLQTLNYQRCTICGKKL